jgi:hypothetical protein
VSSSISGPGRTPLGRTAARLGVPLVSVVALLAGPLGTGSAEAGERPTPGSFTGYAFDACDTPAQAKMNAWLTHSKYWGVGVYVAGMNRACSTQRHLTPSWVSNQAGNGWRILPIVVGRQASCAPKGYYRGKRISAAPGRDYAAARHQGRSAADSGASALRRLGIHRHSVLWFDLENFDTGRKKCRRSAAAFIAGWTNRLHALHYRSGLYSSASSGITVSDAGRRARHKGVPDYLWIAEWNGHDDVRSSYISRAGWWPDRRVHQYRGAHGERHGGVRLNIDSNFLSTGHGTVAGRPVQPCGVRVGFSSYRRVERGDHGPQVRAAQCLLRRQGDYHGTLTGHLGRHTARAVRSFQRAHRALPRSGRVNRRTWTALLSAGDRPLLKFGSGGNPVRRLQRALNAGAGASLEIDGVFGRREMRAVAHLQRRNGRDGTGVVTGRTWKLLQHGRTAHHRHHSRSRHDVLRDVSGIGGTPHSIGAAGPR